ncbi:MAG: hypothetical protein M1444_02520 [Patescibacteria group bacterium]|nr:hypothetical protein [Patescibacteria group bacterium]
MDRFSAFFESKTQAQKTLIIVGGTTLFLIVLAILYFVTTPPGSNTNQTQNNQPPQVTAIPINKTANTFPSNAWKTEENPSYRIDYPPAWNRQVLQVNSGGTLTSLTPPYNGATEAFPRIDIQVTPTGTNITNLQRIENLAPLKLASSEASFKGQKAIKLTGILPFDFVVGNVAKKVNKTFLFFTANGKDYVIDYAYYEDDTAAQSIQELNKALNTLVVLQ